MKEEKSQNKKVKSLVRKESDEGFFILNYQLLPPSQLKALPNTSVNRKSRVSSSMFQNQLTCFGSFCHPVFGQVLGSPDIKVLKFEIILPLKELLSTLKENVSRVSRKFRSATLNVRSATLNIRSATLNVGSTTLNGTFF